LAAQQTTSKALDDRVETAKARLLDLSSNALERIRLAATSSCGQTAVGGLSPLAPDILFPVGSITKLFLATAVARWLDSDAKAGLDTPLGALLGIQASGRPLTLRHLMTHTAGFDCVDSGLVLRPGAREDRDQPPYVPRYVAPVGRAPAYSNYGSALVARVLEQVHDAPIATVLQREVFDPLHMHSTRFVDAAIQLAGLPGQAPFTPMHPFYHAVGAAACSVDDALKFARFVLAAARGAANEILSPTHSRLLTEPLVAARDGSIGVGMFFTIVRRPGWRLISHTGSWIDYAAFLGVLPDQDIAVFAAFLQPETAGFTPDRAWGALVSAITNATPTVACAPPPAAAAGRYISSKRRAGADLALQAFDGAGVTSLKARRNGGVEILGAGLFTHTSSGHALLEAPTPGLSSLAMTFDRDASGRPVLWRAGQREAHVRAVPWALTRPVRRRWAWSIACASIAAGGAAIIDGSALPLFGCAASAAAWLGLRWQMQGLRTLQNDRRGVRGAKIASWILVAAIGMEIAAEPDAPASVFTAIALTGNIALALLQAAIGLLVIRGR
jgi:CubicO group peptidase (beta-lactamase class C family)